MQGHSSSAISPLHGQGRLTMHAPHHLLGSESGPGKFLHTFLYMYSYKTTLTFDFACFSLYIMLANSL